MDLKIFNVSSRKMFLMTITFYASLTLVLIAKTNLIDVDIYANNKSVSADDIKLKKSDISTIRKFKKMKTPYLKLITSSPGPSLSSLEVEGTVSLRQKLEQKILESTCNDDATRRGPHQLIVAFSYYGDLIPNRNFFQGIEENAKLIQKYYPEWLMRVYVNLQPPLVTTGRRHLNMTIGANKECDCMTSHNGEMQEKMCHLQCTYPWLDFCYVKNIPSFGNLLQSQPQIWRFLPMADPLVDMFVSRDLDSRLSEREANAVKEWLSSNLTFHAMRDHPLHTRRFMGGMWGAVLTEKREELLEITKNIVEQGMKRTGRGQDQLFLEEILWPISKGAVLQHDSYHCLRFSKHGNMNPWPNKRMQEPYNFVGSRVGVDKKPLSVTCPLNCRPKDKIDWIYC